MRLHATLLNLDRWSFPDWVSVVGLPLALIGLGIALLQMREAKSTARDARDAARHGRSAAEAAQSASETAEKAATAAQETIKSTEAHLADNHLLVFIPRLDQISRDLESAVAADDQKTALSQLTEWRGIAAQVRKLAERQGGEDELLRKLQLAAALTVSAKDDLLAKRGTTDEATRHVRAAINDACDRAGEIVGERMAFIRRGTE